MSKLAYWFRPEFRLYISLGFSEVHTDLFSYRVEQDVFTFIRLYVRFFKWQFDFDLYETGTSRLLRTKP